jgi:secreted trypsin-like serine protease
VSARSLAHVLSVVAVAFVVGAPAAHAIANGEEADAARTPWMVSITDDTDERLPVSGRCGGSLIAPRLVLTAAHCLEGLEDDALVVAGRQAVGQPAERSARIARVRAHPRYRLEHPFGGGLQESTATSDIGLIELATPIDGPVLRLAPARAARFSRPGRAARLWGYGPIFNRPGACTDPPGTLPPCFAPGSLHQADLRLLSRKACGRSYRRALDATMLCSIDRTGKRRAHACPGDSGSPMAVRDGASWVQVGVVSWGAEVKRRRCDDTDLPTVMAHVSALRGWIDRASRRLSARGTLLVGGT